MDMGVWESVDLGWNTVEHANQDASSHAASRTISVASEDEAGSSLFPDWDGARTPGKLTAILGWKVTKIKN